MRHAGPARICGAILATTVSGCVPPFACADLSCTSAVIVEQTAASRSELQNAVHQVLRAREIKLPDDALMIVPTLVFERTPARDAQGLLLNGRELTKPVVFRLYRQRGKCVLLHIQSGRHWSLPNTQCLAVAD